MESCCSRSDLLSSLRSSKNNSHGPQGPPYTMKISKFKKRCSVGHLDRYEELRFDVLIWVVKFMLICRFNHFDILKFNFISEKSCFNTTVKPMQSDWDRTVPSFLGGEGNNHFCSSGFFRTCSQRCYLFFQWIQFCAVAEKLGDLIQNWVKCGWSYLVLLWWMRLGDQSCRYNGESLMSQIQANSRWKELLS